MEVRDWGKMKETFGYIFWGNKKKQKEEKKRMNNGEDTAILRFLRERELKEETEIYWITNWFVIQEITDYQPSSSKSNSTWTICGDLWDR